MSQLCLLLVVSSLGLLVLCSVSADAAAVEKTRHLRRGRRRLEQSQKSAAGVPALSEECTKYHLVKEFNTSVVDSEVFSQHSFLATYNYRLSADVYYGPIHAFSIGYTSWFEHMHRIKLLNSLHGVECLQPGVVIYVDLGWLHIFFSYWYSVIRVPFVMVTAGSDDSTPGAFAKYLQEANSKILHWYGINCDLQQPLERFSCLPLGLNDKIVWATPDKFNNVKTTLDYMVDFANQTVLAERTLNRRVIRHDPSYDLLMPRFNFGTHPSRVETWHLFCGLEVHDKPILFTNRFNVTSYCGIRTDTIDMFDLTSKSAFVLSPHGNGLDCHRTWETLYLGSFPIVRTSTLDSLYDDLPVLIVKNWEDITPDLLARTYFEFTRKKYSFDRLKPTYWQRLFGSHGYTRYTYNLLNLDIESDNELARLNLKENDLIRGENKKAYLIRNGTKCAIQSVQVFFNRGWEFSSVKKISDFSLTVIKDGPEISE